MFFFAGRSSRQSGSKKISRVPAAAIESLETRQLMSAYSTAVLADKPRGFYEFDETANLTAYNRSSAGAAMNGVYYNNPNLMQQGIVGTQGGLSAKFNISGPNQAVQEIHDPTTYVGLTVEAWVRPSITTDQSILNQTSTAGQFADWSNDLRITNVNGQAHFAFYTFDGAGKSFVAAAAVQAGTLYHVAATVKNGGTITLYVNGVKQAGTNYTDGFAQSSAVKIGKIVNYHVWYIGSNVGTNGLDPVYKDYFHGTIDEVAMYTSVLSASQIAKHYSAGTAVGSFGALSGNVYLDQTGNGIKDGTDGNLPGVTVFFDSNNNGILDSGEIANITDANGNYRFFNLGVGTYTLQAQLNSGYAAVSPKGGTVSVKITTNATATQNFGESHTAGSHAATSSLLDLTTGRVVSAIL